MQAAMDSITIIEGASTAAIADWLAERLADQSAGAGPCAITIPGGSTPFPILADLTLRHAETIDWAELEVWPNDDRIVPDNHDASNTGKIRALLEPVGAKVTALDEAAAPPHFALTWLGMGPDGHIASLFPNTDPRADDGQAIRRLTPDPLPAHAPFDRITLTIPALLDTDALVFTLGGAADKRAVLDAALAGEHDLPIARLLRAAQVRHISVTVFT